MTAAHVGLVLAKLHQSRRRYGFPYAQAADAYWSYRPPMYVDHTTWEALDSVALWAARWCTP